MVLAFAKLLITALGALTSYVSVLLFKGTAILVVTVLRLIQLPGCAVSLFLCAFRAGTVKIFAAVFGAAVEVVALAMNGVASLLTPIVSSNSTAVRSIVEAAKGRPEVLLNAAMELFLYAWEVAKNTAISSAESFFDAVRYVFKHARA